MIQMSKNMRRNMSKFTHERQKAIIEEFPLERREEILKRLEVCKDNIHSPWSWYREDVRMLLINIDHLHTRYLKILDDLTMLDDREGI